MRRRWPSAATASSGRSPKGPRYGLAMSTREGTVTLRIPALRRKRPPRTVYVGSYEDKLSRLGAMHVSPDDDGRTREDRELEQREGRAPSSGGMIGIS